MATCIRRTVAERRVRKKQTAWVTTSLWRLPELPRWYEPAVEEEITFKYTLGVGLLLDISEW